MLNPEQQAVIAHGDTPLLVIAGAGTGKTTVMVHRTAVLLERGQAPERLLLLTFTRRAAEELRTRVAKLLNRGAMPLPWCGTFHSTAARLLRRFGARLGLAPEFSILDESDSRELLGNIAEERFPQDVKNGFPTKGVLSRLHSYRVNTGRDLPAVVQELAPSHVALLDKLEVVFADYALRKRQAASLDFDDLLIQWLALLRVPQGGCAELFDAVMVDEYQDTNVLQAQILEELCRHHARITVVGDDAQAIYGFRGATVENILSFQQQFERVTLLNIEQNYRSTQEILDAANALWAEAGKGFRKNLQAVTGRGPRPRLLVCDHDQDQAERIVGAIVTAWHDTGVPLSEQAVLFRASHHSFRVEMLLRRYKIPFRKYGGQRFTDMAHIKDVFAFLRCRENPRDESAWLRICGLLPGIGNATARRFATALRDAGTDWTTHLAALRFPKKAEPWRQGFVETLTAVFAGERPVQEELAQILEFYGPLMHQLYDEAEARELGLKELTVLAFDYTSRREFLDEMQVGDNSLLGDAPGTDAGEFVTLSTIHSAKGCEWRDVHIMQVVEGGIPAGPSQEDTVKLDEERRLLYVAMTRAKQGLTLYQPQWRESFSQGVRKQSPCRPSRFLTPNVLACIDTNAEFAADDPVYEYEDGTGPAQTLREPRRRYRWDGE